MMGKKKKQIYPRIGTYPTGHRTQKKNKLPQIEEKVGPTNNKFFVSAAEEDPLRVLPRVLLRVEVRRQRARRVNRWVT
jgi:hypothetical protein